MPKVSNELKLQMGVDDDEKSSSLTDSTNKKLVHKKSLIETFQKLFKSSHKKNTATSSAKQQNQQQVDNPNKPIELVNYKKRQVNDSLIPSNSCTLNGIVSSSNSHVVPQKSVAFSKNNNLINNNNNHVS
jgi:hypothetical protein